MRSCLQHFLVSAILSFSVLPTQRRDAVGIRYALLEHVPLPVDLQQPKTAAYAASVASGGITAILAGILSRECVLCFVDVRVAHAAA